MSQLFVCLFLFNTISQTQSPQDVLYCNVKTLHSCMYLYFCLWAHFASSCISSLTDSASISVSPDLPRPLKVPARYCFCSVQVLHWALQPTSVCCRCVLSLLLFMFVLKLFLQCRPCSHEIRSHNSQRSSLQWTKTEHQKQPLSVLPFRCLLLWVYYYHCLSCSSRVWTNQHSVYT